MRQQWDKLASGLAWADHLRKFSGVESVPVQKIHVELGLRGVNKIDIVTLVSTCGAQDDVARLMKQGLAVTICSMWRGGGAEEDYHQHP